ncbi:helix-turn-helix transcriptional regulator [Fervidibacillus albus]|uniref:AraC family transcriptional regulator n=1 Tax=Fervidibacillus albus TaxID=2980026 RepID=A0A9E8RYY4_9BACI|nr:AraC family transcriptional regulator [Fervidibacillus albus]WAA11147.1 AraC family transcriptional regulator [Fervidibacillus albus]
MEMLEHHSFHMHDEYALQSLLYQFFSILADRPKLPKNQKSANENEYVRKAITFIQNHYNEQIKLTDIAAFVSLHRSYLSTIFKKETGISIQQYLTVFRLSRAAELLRITDLTIEQIAQSCGYHDPLVFSKNFKKQMDMTPTEYRKSNNVRFADPF